MSTDAGKDQAGSTASEPKKAATPKNAQKPGTETGAQQTRALSPNEVAQLVMMQVNNINTKKDELTIAIKNLSDLTNQLVRAHSEQSTVIQALQKRIKELEGK